jgi:Uma2 family endonuclease
MATQPVPVVTFDEYLRHEDQAAFKSEYSNGHVYAMAGGTERHSRLSVRALIVLSQRFPDCRVYDSNLKLRIGQHDECVYPDAMLLCGAPEFYKDREDVILNPTLIVEILSPSTERHDQYAKSAYYRDIPSLMDFLLISQETVRIDHFARKDPFTWTVTTYIESSSEIAVTQGRVFTVNDFYATIF